MSHVKILLKRLAERKEKLYTASIMKLFTPGPIAMDPETLAIGGKQAQYFRTPAFSSLMLECESMLKEVLDAPKDTRMIFLTAAGTAAMEASVINLFTTQDKVIVINGGTFGKRFKQICKVHQIPFESIDLEWNEQFNPRLLDKYENSGITGMLVNMCETSTGQLYPMDVISSFCRRNKVCLVVDSISAFLCDPFSMKETGADAVIISSQKGLALHPGMSFVAVTKESFEKRCEKNNPSSLYFNFVDCEKDMKRGQTPFTPAVAIINQLHEKLCRIIRDGVNYHVEYIMNLADYFRNELSTKTQFTIPKYTLSNSVTPVYCPEKNAQEIIANLIEKHDIYVTPCAGDLADFLIRVAHMSRQITRQDIDQLILLLK